MKINVWKNRLKELLPLLFFKNRYTDDDLKKLPGYDLMEVLNHSANSEKNGIALSVGEPVWVVEDDDAHD